MPFTENPKSSNQRCFAIIEKECVLHKDGSELNFSDLLNFKRLYSSADFIEEEQGGLCAILLPSKELITSDYAFQTLRQYFAANEEQKSAPLFRAKHILEWRKNTRFCPLCAAKLQNHKTLSALECPACKKTYFPRIEPCVIVAVRNKEGKVLLARHTYRNTSMHACIAGFIEAGESAESAVRREVFEETGLLIKNLTYRGSQSWPFPDQMMFGFTAEYESGELKIQKTEIADAGWFDPDNCPDSPPPGSIAYKLIHNLF